MARRRGKNEPSTYQPRQSVPPEVADRVELVRAILAERLTISAAAEQLGIARVNMQTLAHRAEAAIIAALTPRPSGPPAKSTRERELEQQVKRLHKENAKLHEQRQAADDMMGAAGEIIRSLRGLPPRPSSRTSSPRSPRTSTAKTDKDPESDLKSATAPTTKCDSEELASESRKTDSEEPAPESSTPSTKTDILSRQVRAEAGEAPPSRWGAPPKPRRASTPTSARVGSADSASESRKTDSEEPASESATSTTKEPGPVSEFSTATPERDSEDPKLESSTTLTRVLARIATIPEQSRRAARVLGIGGATLQRWLGRLALGQPLHRSRGGSRAPIEPAADQAVRAQVRSLAGMVGAASLSRHVPGVSRRAASCIKRDELAALERERKVECARVKVTCPGVVRGFDAMHLPRGFALVAADAHVPFRTSAHHVPVYNAEQVAMALNDDFIRHGPPLVLRFDRARCHDAEPVASLLRAFDVLPLHGPAYYPRYYGQLERQNREHRTWLNQNDASDPPLAAMITALNRDWRRPTLGWRTAEEVWVARPLLGDDRDELREEVHQRAARRQAEGITPDLAMRLAIEQALTKRGYLRITTGRQSLCEQSIA